MANVTQPLRDEHQELLPEVEFLRLAGDAIGTALTASTHEKIDRAYQFLTHHLLPHARAEEKALYPVVQRVMGASASTATMSRDHIEVDRLTRELASLQSQAKGMTLSTEQVNALRCVLYGLYTLVKVHFAKEEEVYLPLLDSNLSPAQARQMFEAMEKAAGEAKAHPNPSDG